MRLDWKLLALSLAAFAAAPSQARLGANAVTWKSKRDYPVNLVESRLKATVGPQWVDIEEEAELQVPSEFFEVGDDILVEGTLSLPAHAAMTGCLLWNDDTLLLGKLRGRQDAEHKFDSLVPDRPVNYAADPLLLDMVDDSTYGFKLYPFSPGGTRRFRLRYLLPLTASREFEIKPLLARMVNGSIPDKFTLQVRGNRSDIKLVTPESIWPLTLPADRSMELGAGSIKLRWGAAGNPDGSIAARARIDSGAWKGDYVFYQAKVPDSILAKVALRSETVVLWRWVQSKAFVAGDLSNRTLTSYGNDALLQARALVAIGDQLTGRGDRFGLVADLGLDDSLQVYPVSDSGTREYRTLRGFLTGINADYLKWRIPAGAGTGTASASNLELSRNRLRFRTDLQQVGSLYSRDSSLIKHLLVVTVGPIPTGGDQLEIPDASLLPPGVSVATSSLTPTSSYVYNAATGGYTNLSFLGSAAWPGVNLTELVATRPGTGKVVSQGGVMLPLTSTALSATLSIKAGDGSRLAREASIRKGPDGVWRTSFNVHGLGLGKDVRWDFWVDGDSAAHFVTTPAWESQPGDSILPRLWARSEAPYSPVFLGKELAPRFGFVDPLYSLLAMPSDSVGRMRQVALRDSGVPFLTSAEIFPRVGYVDDGGDPSTGISLRPGAGAGLRLAYLPSRRVVRIELAGTQARSLEILDLRGRVEIGRAHV